MLILFQSRAHRERELSHTLTDTHRLNADAKWMRMPSECGWHGVVPFRHMLNSPWNWSLCYWDHGSSFTYSKVLLIFHCFGRWVEVFFFVLLVFGAVAGKEQIGASVVNVWESNRNSSVFTIASVEQITCFAITWFNCTHTHTNTFKHILVMRLMANTSHFGDDYSMACRTYVVVS